MIYPIYFGCCDPRLNTEESAERGLSCPDLVFFDELAACLGVGMEELLSPEEEDPHLRCSA